MLFQPTSITPDHLGGIGNGIVDPALPLTVSWLVNGNSAMTAFKIDYYYNNASSTLIRSTGKLTDNCPFYGTDALGNRKFFSYEDSTTDLTTTDEWKMVITQWWSADDYVTQSSPSAFTTRSAPTLSLTIPATVAQRDYTFTATYSQTQGDALNWVRWQIAVNTEEGRANPLYDSGNIYGTALLECYYDGFFSGTSYAVNVMIETQSGVQAETGWRTFSCSYTQDDLAGQCIATKLDCGRTGVKVEWNGFRYIYGIPTGDYTIADGILSLPSGSSVLWDEVNGSAMSIGTDWNIIYHGKLMKQDATLFEVQMGSHSLTLTYVLSSRRLYLKYDSTTLKYVATINYESDITVIVTPTTYYLRREYYSGGLYPNTSRYPTESLYPLDDDTFTVAKNSYSITYTQSAITGILVGGVQECDYIQEVSASTLDADLIAEIYTDGTYKATPVSGTNFLADFVNDLNAGSLYIAGTQINGWAVYRQQKDNPILMHIADTEMSTTMLYDYSVCSGQGMYKYYVYPIGTNVYITSPLISNEIDPVFWNWSVLECSFNDDMGMYELENEFLFGKNLESGALSNNNKPSVLENFTPYPTVQLSPQRYKSGSLSSLIGNVTMGSYADTIDQREAIDKLSITTNSLFLKNRKGDLWEIRISDSISFSTMDNAMTQPQTVSLSWVQIADASEASIVKIIDPATLATVDTTS